MPTQRDWQRYARKGKTAARGYGRPHQKLRAKWKPAVDAGQEFCRNPICLMPYGPRVGRWIPPGTPWHLGHTPDRTAWTGPEHEQCNIADANRRRAHRPRTSPGWFTSRRW
jgi:hypothetical protein